MAKKAPRKSTSPKPSDKSAPPVVASADGIQFSWSDQTPQTETIPFDQVTPRHSSSAAIPSLQDDGTKLYDARSRCRGELHGRSRLPRTRPPRGPGQSGPARPALGRLNRHPDQCGQFRLDRGGTGCHNASMWFGGVLRASAPVSAALN